MSDAREFSGNNRSVMPRYAPLSALVLRKINQNITNAHTHLRNKDTLTQKNPKTNPDNSLPKNYHLYSGQMLIWS